jgi:hypothetical protein
MGFAEKTEVTGWKVDFTLEYSIDYLSCQAILIGIIVRTQRHVGGCMEARAEELQRKTHPQKTKGWATRAARRKDIPTDRVPVGDG